MSKARTEYSPNAMCQCLIAADGDPKHGYFARITRFPVVDAQQEEKHFVSEIQFPTANEAIGHAKWMLEGVPGHECC